MDYPQLVTQISPGGNVITTTIEAPWVSVTSVNGRTGDVIVGPTAVNFQPNTWYMAGTLVIYNNLMYYAKQTFTSGNTFNPDDWKDVKGEKGDTGSGLNIIGELQSESELPTTGRAGDAYMIDGDLYVWVGTGGNVPSHPQWSNVGHIQGPQGVKGETGDTGNGIQSTTLNSDYTLTIRYTNGTQYTTSSIRGAKGDKGSKGDTGDTGPQGYSPSATVTRENDGATISITDKTGTTTSRVYDGGITLFTNSVAGKILGSTTIGNISANSDGTGTVNGFSTVKNTVDTINGEYVKVVLSTTDIGEGQPLPERTLYGVYQ